MVGPVSISESWDQQTEYTEATGFWLRDAQAWRGQTWQRANAVATLAQRPMDEKSEMSER